LFNFLKPMRHIQTFNAMILIVSLFLIFFYSTLHHQTVNTLRVISEKPPKQLDLHVQDSGVKHPSTQEGFTKTDLNVHSFPISDELGRIIPQNGAYWNRLLFSALRSLDDGENPFRNEYPWPVCRQENEDLLRINVHDFNSYPVLFQAFLQGMNCKSPPILISQPDRCSSGGKDGNSQTFLLFAIKSIPRNFEQRQAVRETWGREGVYQRGLRVRIVFLLGASSQNDPDLSRLLSYEAKLYKDMLQWDFQDTLLNLTLKMNMLLKWTVKHCPQVSFVFSGDDDVFVNTPALLTYLQSLEASKASQLYVGHVISSASPLRDHKSKYYIPSSFYDGPYPPYAGGGGFLISGSLLQPLYFISRVIPFFPIDDVYMGMCTKALEVSPQAHKGFQTFDVKEQDRENVCVHKGHLLLHHRSPQHIKRMWKGINSPLLTC